LELPPKEKGSFRARVPDKRGMLSFSVLFVLLLQTSICNAMQKAEESGYNVVKDCSTFSVSGDEVMQCLLPAFALETLTRSFDLFELPNVSVSLVNEKMVLVQGLPLAKLEGLLQKELMARSLSLEEYLSFVVPGPILSGHSEKDVKSYRQVIESFEKYHPEVMWYQPREWSDLKNSNEGISRLIEIQRNAKHSSELGQLIIKANSSDLKSEPDKAAN